MENFLWSAFSFRPTLPLMTLGVLVDVQKQQMMTMVGPYQDTFKLAQLRYLLCSKDERIDAQTCR